MIFHLMCHQMPFWCGIRCKIFLENYGCGCVWAVPELKPRKVDYGVSCLGKVPDCVPDPFRHFLVGPLSRSKQSQSANRLAKIPPKSGQSQLVKRQLSVFDPHPQLTTSRWSVYKIDGFFQCNIQPNQYLVGDRFYRVPVLGGFVLSL